MTCKWCFDFGGDDGKPCPDCGKLKGPASGAPEDAPISSSQSTGTLPTDAIWKLLNEADDEKTAWSPWSMRSNPRRALDVSRSPSTSRKCNPICTGKIAKAK